LRTVTQLTEPVVSKRANPMSDALRHELKVPRLGEPGVQQSDFDLIAGKAIESSSTKGNPVELAPGQLREILERAF
jgi:alcohol dehydrogenase class IV